MSGAGRSEILDLRWGLALAILTLLFGFLMGAVFGIAEDSLKAALKARGEAVVETVYGGDAEGPGRIAGRSWSYMKRAHLHGGGLGAAALALILLLAALPAQAKVKRVAALFLGLGGLGYSVFWLLAAWRAPVLGSTGAAKESLAWLALPSSMMVIVGTFAVLAFLLRGARSSS